MSDDIKLYVQGVQFIIGRLKGETTTIIQSVLFDSSVWEEKEARDWLGDHDFKSSKLDSTDKKFRFRQKDPSEFQKESFRTIQAKGSSMERHGGGTVKKPKKKEMEGDDEAHSYFMDSPGAFYSTGETSFHLHKFNPTAAFTEIPHGVFKGHRHEILRNVDGQITSFSEALNHTHSLPDFVEDRVLTTDEIALLYKEENDGDLFSIKGIEIFKVGTWNGDQYTRSDLDEMVRNFKKVGFPVPIKVGHKETSGSPAFGWIAHIRRVGDMLVADFKDLSKRLWQSIKDRQFDSVSSEVFWDLERDGKKFRRVLKAVALLGAETPAVSGLAPLRTVINSITPPEAGFDRVGTYSFNLSKEEVDMGKLEELEDRVEELQEELDTAKVAAAEAEEKAGSSAKGDAAKEAAVELKEAQEQVEKLEADLKTAQEETKRLVEDQSEEIASLKKQVDELTDSLGAMSETQRQERIKKKVDDVPIPAMRKFIQPLYELATSTAKTVKFTAKDDEGAKDTEVEVVLDAMVMYLRSDASKLFREFAESQNSERKEGDDPYQEFSGDPSVVADKRAREYMDKNTDVKYPDAVKHVLSQDDKLNQAYAGFTSSRNS